MEMHDERITTPVADTAPAGFCPTCQRILPLRMFQHLVPAQSRVAKPQGGRGVANSRWQEWRVCKDCRVPTRKLPPVHRMTPAQLVKASGKGLIDQRLLDLHGGALLDRARERVNVSIARGQAARWEREHWQPPWTHAIDTLTLELERVRGQLRYARSTPAQHGAQELVRFLVEAEQVVVFARDALRLRRRRAAGDREGLAAYRRQQERVQERARGAHGRVMGRPRQDMGYDPARVMVAESVWSDFIPVHQLERLDELFDEVPVQTKARRLRHLPVIMRREALCLDGFTPVQMHNT